ncbi:MAG: oligopeptide/dipeptide ABC transporter ATP-binding protein [Halobacteriota archaeon]
MPPNLNRLAATKPEPGETILSVEDLRVQFATEGGIVRAVDGISFDVRYGETVGLVGESGAGKSVSVTGILRLLQDPGTIVDGDVTYRGVPLVDFLDAEWEVSVTNEGSGGSTDSDGADGSAGPSAARPAVDTFQGRDEVRFVATIPAVDPTSLRVTCDGTSVRLTGEAAGGGLDETVELPRRVQDDSGEARLRGEELTVDFPQVRSRRPSGDMLSDKQMRRFIRGNEIAIIFQDPMETLNPVYKVGAQVREFIELNRDLTSSEAKDEAIRMLREVGIPEPENRYHDYPHEFSGGMRQRVLIAMAMGCRPNLIIADEPTTALDVTVEGQIIELVRDLQEEYGTSFIWVTHDMGVIAELCDRENVMYLGKVIEQGPVNDIFYETKHPYTESLLNSIPRPDRTVDALEPISGVMPEATNPPPGCRFHTRCPHARTACQTGDPPFFEFDGEGHRAACIRHDVEGGPTGYHESEDLAPGEQSLADVEKVAGDD